MGVRHGQQISMVSPDFCSQTSTYLHLEMTCLGMVPIQCHIKHYSMPFMLLYHLQSTFTSQDKFREWAFALCDSLWWFWFVAFVCCRSATRIYLNSKNSHVNWDTIVVHPGRYTGVGNSGIFVVRIFNGIRDSSSLSFQLNSQLSRISDLNGCWARCSPYLAHRVRWQRLSVTQARQMTYTTAGF